MSQRGKIESAEKLAKKLGTNGRERSKAGRPGDGTDCSVAGLKEAPAPDADMSPQGLDGHRLCLRQVRQRDILASPICSMFL